NDRASGVFGRDVAAIAIPWETGQAWPSLPPVAAPVRTGIEGANARASAPAGAWAGSDPGVALMLGVQAGDGGAVRGVFGKFGPRVLQYARRLVGSEARAEQVTQDVFVQVFRFRQRYRPEARFATWLFTIATNLCLNELRRPERQLKVDIWDRPEETDE